MTLNIAVLREQYPQPVTEGDVTATHPAAYCVGGAVCQAAHALLGCVDVDNWQFPSERALAWVLRDLNPALGPDDPNLDIEDTPAIDFAEAIIVANDTRQFAEAWQQVEAALAYRRTG